MSAVTFSTGKPCKHGHLAPRYIVNGCCVQCAISQATARHKAHPDKMRAAVQKYRLAHPERPRAYSRAYAKAFPAKVKACNAAYYAKHPGKATADKLAWTRANPERHNATSMRTHTRKMNAPGRGVTAEQRQEILDAALGVCVYCNERRALNLDHIEPLLPGGAHDIENIAPACKSCNSSKSDHTLLIWLAYRALARAA